MAKILVTGVAGFIASHTVEYLLQAGHMVIGVDNLRTGREQNLAMAMKFPRFVFHRADIAEPGVLLHLVTENQPEVIIHLAALVSVPESIANPKLNHRLNYAATQLVADAAVATRTVHRIVFASSAAVYGDNPNLPLAESAECRPLSPYGQAKLDSERLLLDLAHAHRITVRCQRYFNVYGPRQDPSSAYSGVISRFAEAAQKGIPPHIHGDGQQTRDFIYVGDVAHANLLAATKPNIHSGIANICTGKGVTLNELSASLGKIRGRIIVPTYGPPRSGDIRRSVGSPHRAVQELGLHTCTSLERGLACLLAG